MHPWRSKGEKRTVVWEHEPDESVTVYLRDMQDAIRYALQVAYRTSVRDREGGIPSPIALRREVRDWFNSRYDYARHHINPVCRTAVAMLKSHRRRGDLRIPEVKRLAMRVDSELFKIVGSNNLRITLRPKQYVWLPINTSNKHYAEYSRGRASELLITDRKVCLTFVVNDEGKKKVGESLVASDLNFRTVDFTKASMGGDQPALVSVKTQPLNEIVRIQNDFSRRRRALQERVTNPQKRTRKLRETRGRQRNRIKDALHKLSTRQIRENPGASFVFENLKGIRNNGERRSRRFRTYLNRWPYRMYQSMVDYKSQNRTLYVRPRGTSTECPVCGGKLEHPAWVVSRCVKCGVDYDRDRLASLAILCRGLRLCGRPFAVSADASWQQLRDEYLYPDGAPEAIRAGRTDAVSAPNGDAVHESTHS